MEKNRKVYLKKGIRNPKNAWYVVRTNLDMMGSRIFFKNSAGLKNNLRGRKTIKDLREIGKKYEAHNLNHSDILQLKNNGFTNLKQPFDQTLLSQIIEKYNNMIDDDNYSFIRSKTPDGVVSSRMINKAFEVFPEVKNLFTDNIKKMIEDYYQNYFQIIHVMMWRTYHVPQKINLLKEQYGSNWHCDGADTSITTMFTNISDVTDNDGPLHFQTIDRTKELIKKGYKTRNNYNLSQEIIEDVNFVQKHMGLKGSTVWVNTQYCLHRAGITKPGHTRDMLQFRFKPSNEPLRDDWLERCELLNDEINYNNIQN